MFDDVCGKKVLLATTSFDILACDAIGLKCIGRGGVVGNFT